MKILLQTCFKKYSYISIIVLVICLLSNTSVYAGQQSVILTDDEKAWLKEHPSIVFGMSDSFEPAVIIGKDGRLSGVLIDFLNRLNNKLETDFKVETGKWSHILQKAEKGEIAGIAGLSKPQAQKRGLLTTRSHFTTYVTVFTNSDIASIIQSPEALAGKTIAVLRNDLFSRTLLNNYKDRVSFINTDTVLEALMLVYKRKADAMIGYSYQNYLVSKYMLTGVVPAYFFRDRPMKSYMGVRPDFPELVSILNKGIASFTEAELSSILSRWTAVPLSDKTDEPEPVLSDSLLSEDEKKWIKTHPDITLGFLDSMHPLVIKGEKGKYSGLLIDILNMLNHRLGTAITVKTDSWVQVQNQAVNKEIDGILGMAPELADKIGLLKTHSYFKSYMTIFARNDSLFEINTLKDLEGKRVSIIRGMAVHQIFSPYIDPDKINLIETDNATEALRMVFEQKADAMIGISHNNYIIAKEGFTGLIPAYFLRELPVNGVIGIRPDRPELVSILNKGIASITESEILGILNKWGDMTAFKNHELSKEEKTWIKSHPLVRAHVHDLPPYHFWQNGQPKGVSVDYLNKIGEMFGFETQYVSMTWPEALENIRNHELVDVLLTTARTPERETYMAFSRDYSKIPVVIFTQKDIQTIFGLKDLAGKTIAMPERFSLQRKLAREYPQIKQLLVKSPKEALVALSENKVDAYVCGLNMGQFYLVHLGFSNIKVAAPAGINDYQIAFAVRNDWQIFTSILNKGLAKISPEERAAIHYKYYVVDSVASKINYKQIVWVFSGIMLLVAGILVWNRSLRKKVAQSTMQLKKYGENLEVLVKERTIELRTAKENAQKAQKAAEEANRAKSTFLANMSHEIRTPMNVITGFAALALRSGLTSEQQNYLDKIRIASDSLLQIINDILDFSKIEAGKLEVVKRPFKIQDIFDDISEMFCAQAAEMQNRLTFGISPGLPPFLIGDSGRIRQILINLVDNAIKFTQNGRISIKAECKEEKKDRFPVSFIVKDTGTGISPGKQGTVFGVFSQADDSTTRKHGGTGLGLAICRQLTELMGGTIKLESRPGRGSTFTCTIPFEKYKDTVNGSAIITGDSRTYIPVSVLKGTKILLAEDNDLNCEIVVKLLNDEGIITDTVKNGSQACEAVKSKKYDAVLMDVQMPVMDGHEAARKIRESDKKIPIIALTAHAMDKDRELCLEAGMNDYITKPVVPERIYEALIKQIKPGAAIIKQAKKEQIHEFPDIDGVDVRAAIERLGGDIVFLKKMLGKFAHKWSNLPQSLHQNLADDNWKQLRILSHSLKGMAGNLSAYELENAAKELEFFLNENTGDKIKKQDLYTQIDTKILKIEKALAKVLNSIKLMETMENFISNNDDEKDKKMPDISEISSILIKLSKSMAERNTDSVEIMKSVSVMLKLYGLEKQCRQLKSQVEMYDFKASQNTLKSIMEILEIKL